MATIYTLEALEVTGSGGFFIDQVTSQSFDLAIEEYMAGQSSRIDDAFATVMKQSPKITISTTKVQTMLTNVGIGGKAIDGTTNTVILYFKARAAGGTYTTGSTHKKLTIPMGLLVPTTIRASFGEAAMLDVEFHVLFDGTNAPVQTGNTSALPTRGGVTDALAAEIFTVGPVFADNSEYEHVQNVNINFGINVGTVFASGVPWPKQAHITKRQPVIEATILHVDRLDVLWVGTTTSTKIEGGPIAEEVMVYLRRKLQSGANELDATAKHLKFKTVKARKSVRTISLNDADDASLAVQFRPLDDGTNAILTITADQAIVSTG